MVGHQLSLHPKSCAQDHRIFFFSHRGWGHGSQPSTSLFLPFSKKVLGNFLFLCSFWTLLSSFIYIRKLGLLPGMKKINMKRDSIPKVPSGRKVRAKFYRERGALFSQAHPVISSPHEPIWGRLFCCYCWFGATRSAGVHRIIVLATASSSAEKRLKGGPLET